MQNREIGHKKQPVIKSIKEVIAKRHLIISFVKRDLKIQFAQTYFGVFWLLLQPILAITAYTLFFENFIKLDTGNIPYPVFVFSGFLFWQYFVHSFVNSGNALIFNQNIIANISFPKLIVVISKPLTGLLSLIINFFILIILLLYYKIIPTVYFITFPVIIILIYATGLAFGIWLNSLTLRYRDLQHLLPTVIQYAIWITPVFYPVSIVPKSLFFIVYLNPVAGIIEWFRWMTFGGNMPSVNYFFGIGFAFLILISGLIYFNKIEHKIADKV